MSNDQASKDEKITIENQLTRIRDIILGEKYQQLESQLESLEKEFSGESEKLNAEIQKLRLNFEIYIEATLKSLAKKVDKNKEESETSLGEIQSSIKDLDKQIRSDKASTEKRLEMLNKLILKNKESFEKEFVKLNKQWIKQKDETDKNLTKTIEALKGDYLKELKAIKQNIVSRNNLASLLSELSVQLEDDNTSSEK